MAEGWARHLKSDIIEPHSAGIKKSCLNPKAVQVMKEAGVDISAQYSKHVSELSDIDFDFVVTVCDHASETCPAFLTKNKKTKIVHVGFDDPPKLEQSETDEEKK